MRYWAIVLTLAGSVAYGAEDGGMERTLTLPHPLAPGAIAWLQVQVGPLAPGQRVRVTTRSGELLGALSPFGAGQRQQSGIYSIAIPPGAIRDGTLAVIVTITGASNPPRAPTATEVQSLKLMTPDAAR